MSAMWMYCPVAPFEPELLLFPSRDICPDCKFAGATGVVLPSMSPSEYALNVVPSQDMTAVIFCPGMWLRVLVITPADDALIVETIRNVAFWT